MKRFQWSALVAYFLLAGSASAVDMMDDIRLFQNYFSDAVTLQARQAEVTAVIADDDVFSSFVLSVQGDMPLDNGIDIGARWALVNMEPDTGKSVNGLDDLTLGGRLHWDVASEKTNVSLGGTVSLPVGDDNIGAANLDVGGFAALRHHVEEGLVVTGKLALVSVEVGNDRDLSLQLGAGAIYHYSDKIFLVSELELQSKTKYSVLSVGADYSVDPAAHFRGSIQLGAGDGAPDLGLLASYLFQF